MALMPDAAPTSPLIHNERIKLRANALNTAATSSFAIGVLAPLASALYGVQPDRLHAITLVIGVVAWFVAAIYTHSRAQAVLGGLWE